MSPNKPMQPPRVAGKKRVTKTAKAEIIFPVSGIRNQMVAGRYAKIIGTGSAVYMAAVLEYLAADILEAAGYVANEANKHRINPRHITLAVRNDADLDELLKDVTISGGGVVLTILK